MALALKLNLLFIFVIYLFHDKLISTLVMLINVSMQYFKVDSAAMKLSNNL